MKAVVGLIVWLLVTFSAAVLGALATRSAPEFYGALSQPSWAPAAWVFGPVWTVLYVLMAVAAWLVWKEKGVAGARRPLTLFVVQLALNACWSWLFFGWRQGGLAAAEIIMLLGAIALTSADFWRIRRWAGALMLPYLVWVSYATALTFALVRRNPDVL